MHRSSTQAARVRVFTGNARIGRNRSIEADIVVNCGGMWAMRVGRMAVSRAASCLRAFLHRDRGHRGLTQLPVLRVPDECAYYKEDAGKMLLGAFEPNRKPWAMNGIPEDFCFDQLPEDFDHFEPILEAR